MRLILFSPTDSTDGTDYLFTHFTELTDADGIVCPTDLTD